MDNLQEKNWSEFRRSGLLWFVNSILHLFGWAIVFEIDNGDVKRVIPARVDYRGFTEEDNTEGYRKVSKYLQENIGALVEETEK